MTYLPTTVRGIWLYPYLVIDVWSRKMAAWDVAEREVSSDIENRATSGPVRAGGLGLFCCRCLVLLMGPALA